MLFDGDTLQIDMDTDPKRLEALRAFVATRLEYIDEIRVNDTLGILPSQRLLQLLSSIKKSRPQIRIPLLDKKNYTTAVGTARWILA